MFSKSPCSWEFPQDLNVYFWGVSYSNITSFSLALLGNSEVSQGWLKKKKKKGKKFHSFISAPKLFNQSHLVSHKFCVSSLIRITKAVLLHPRWLWIVISFCHPESIRVFSVNSLLKCPLMHSIKLFNTIEVTLIISVGEAESLRHLARWPGCGKLLAYARGRGAQYEIYIKSLFIF